MRKFTILEGLAAVLADINIDTDAIIPKQFLKTIEREGLGKSAPRATTEQHTQQSRISDACGAVVVQTMIDEFSDLVDV